MKKPHILLSMLLAGVMILAGCNLGATPPAMEAPVEPSQPPAETEPPVLTEVPIVRTEPPTLVPVPIDLSGPPMEVGSKFPYVDGSILVAVPGGEFTMGHGGEDNPEHIVNVSDFWMYRAKVTNSQYGFCVAMGKCTRPDPEKNVDYGDSLKANHPVVGVNHEQAASYCSFVNGRLPTEAEWEKAARGPDGNIYPWGDATPICDLANFGVCYFKTTSVVELPEGMSYYEALDMAGNAYEWVADWYERFYYSKSPVDDPLGPDLGFKRSVRSNGFNSPAYESESARRFSANPIDQRSDLGFRCVVEDPIHFAPYCEALLVYGQDAGSGMPSGGSPSEICPAVSITQNPYCNGLIPVTNVELLGPPGATFDPNGCVPTGNPNQYACQPPGGNVSVTADCQQTLPGSPACPPGFMQQGDTCVSQGGQGVCLPGFNYDPANQCCTAAPGQDTSFDLPLCPVGTYYIQGQNVCVPYPAQGIVSVVESVNFLNCIPDPTKTPGSGGGCPVQSCSGTPFPSSWDPTLCCCYNPFKGCQ